MTTSQADAASSLDEHFMRLALAEAMRAAELGEVPVGAVFVEDGKVIATGYNLREHAQDPSAHAELIALRAACFRAETWRLDRATCYVTLEPCPMCAGALVAARVPRVVWGANDPKAGAVTTLYNIGRDPRLNHQFEAVAGVLESECAAVLKEFFASLRRRR